MTTEANKQLVYRFAELSNQRNWNDYAQIIVENYIQHNPMLTPGLRGIQEGFQAFLTVFPDLQVTVESVLAEGDYVVGRFTWSGTHKADFMGISATGKYAKWSSMDWWRVEDNKLAEHWDVVDWSSLLQQLQS
jgi:steroid delta-isomerase-like uncharacterized protein